MTGKVTFQEAPDQDHAAGVDRGADARQGENENGGEGADVSPRDLHSPEPMWTIDELIHAQANDCELKPVYEAKIGDGNQPDITKFSFLRGHGNQVLHRRVAAPHND